MNCTSAVETGGSFALVFDDKTFVRLPGAPGCTTTGLAGAGFCAQLRKGDKPESALAVESTQKQATTLTTNLSARKCLTCRKYLFIVGLAFSNVAETLARLCTKGKCLSAKLKPCFVIGIVRMRSPVTVNRMARGTNHYQRK
jgi:hypothetical protein